METTFFWITWGVVSYWALKTFYFSFSKDKLERLRKSTLGIHLSFLVLLFLPWLPPVFGGKSGFMLAWEGNILAVLFIILIIVPLVLFHIKDMSKYKIASGVTIANTFVLFALMYQIRPDTFILSLYDIAPIFAFSMLLVDDVIVLLLWQQLDLKNRKNE